MKTNKQKILEYIQEKASEQETVSFTAQQLQEVFDIQRANISTALNQLCTEAYLVKSAGRPVRYTLKDNAVQEDDFSNIVGANGSLKNVVKLAKACMLYPEKNICAYISGERGSGKRYFVKKMYAYAKSKGLDLQTVLNSVSTGAAGSKQLDAFGPKILAGDYAPGFFMKHFIKDMKLALTEANRSNLNLDVLSQVLANYELLQAEGYGDLGTQALIKYYEEEMEE